MNFNNIGKIDITDLKTKILNLNQDVWLKNTTRQKIFKAHRNTETINLLFDVESFSTNKKGTVHPDFYLLEIDKFIKEITPIYLSLY